MVKRIYDAATILVVMTSALASPWLVGGCGGSKGPGQGTGGAVQGSGGAMTSGGSGGSGAAGSSGAGGGSGGTTLSPGAGGTRIDGGSDTRTAGGGALGSGGVTTGGTSGSGGAGGTGGTGGASACPTASPSNAAPCPTSLQGSGCYYDDCSVTGGRKRAVCASSSPGAQPLWAVDSFPCGVQTMCAGDGAGQSCPVGQVCLVLEGGARTVQCVPHTCGTGPITCDCVQGCFPGCSMSSAQQAVTFTCNTCTDPRGCP